MTSLGCLNLKPHFSTKTINAEENALLEWD